MALATITNQPNIAKLPLQERLRLTIVATVGKVPVAVGGQLKQLLIPGALKVVLAVLVVWTGLQFTGWGEVADAALLCAGWIAMGGSAIQGGKELIAFAVGVHQAKSNRDIDAAAGHLAQAISLIGVQAVLMMLLHTAPKPYRIPGQKAGFWDFGPPPRSPAGRWTYQSTAKLVPPATLPGAQGVTSAWGDIEVSSALSQADARATLLHEQVHSFLTPKLYFLREFRVQLAIQGYGRSVFLRYLEEALAETYAQLRTRGLDMDAFIEGITFPSSGYDITIAKAGKEIQGVFLGPINAGGIIWNVWVNRKK